MRLITKSLLMAETPNKVAIPHGWRQISGLKFTAAETRWINYLAIVSVIGAPFLFLLFGIDPIAAVAASFKNHWNIATTFAAIIGVALLHEPLHMVVHPDHGLSDATLLGARFPMFFVAYVEPMALGRFFAVLMAPLVISGTALIGLMILFPAMVPGLLMALVSHIGQCGGDIMLLFKIRRRLASCPHKQATRIWNSGTGVLVQ
jgi:multidrug transporter EmrE-like cation transporter